MMKQIETMLKFCNPNQGANRDRHLRRYLKRGRTAVEKCAKAIQDINERFAIWSALTTDLFKALEEMSGKCTPTQAYKRSIYVAADTSLAKKASDSDAVKTDLR